MEVLLTDGEILNIIHMYFDCSGNQQYNAILNCVKEIGNRPDEVRVGLIKYVDGQIEINKNMHDMADGDLKAYKKAKAVNHLNQLTELRKIIQSAKIR